MISRVRNSKIAKFLLVLMGFYLLNISIDAPDIGNTSVSEDLTINDQESILEIVVEKVLGFENAIAERDDNDAEDHNSKNNFQKDYFFQTINFVSACRKKFRSPLKYRAINSFPTDGFYRFDSPPPKI